MRRDRGRAGQPRRLGHGDSRRAHSRRAGSSLPAGGAYDGAVANRIDLNADVGESFGPWRMGADAALMPHVTSANVACGFHAGDPLTIRRTVRLALDAAVAIGAHPGFPDLVGFGRRSLAMAPDELEAAVLYQVAALDGIVRSEGGRLTHVKAHGALYHHVAGDGRAAVAFATAIARLDPSLRIVGPPGAVLLDAAARLGVPSVVEAFADRVYEADGRLRRRDLPGALNGDPDVAAAQAVAIARDGRVTASDGSVIEISAQTICLHGDTPGAPAIAAAVRRALAFAGIEVRGLGA